MKKALLVVSFGTSYKENRKITIEALESDLRQQFPERKFYHAYTSGIIRKKIEQEEKLTIPSVAEALQQMIADGMEDVLVQPTHVIDGIENHRMKDEVQAAAQHFQNIAIGKVLLADENDYEKAVTALMGTMSEVANEKTALFLMGHGSAHRANDCYQRLDDIFHRMGYQQVFVGTVEALPDLEAVLHRIDGLDYKRIVLQPFMLVAGDHAHNDMSGDDEESWKEKLEKTGYEVVVNLVGLGELKGIRDIYVEHAKKASAFAYGGKLH